jgi:hypothetical protein
VQGHGRQLGEELDLFMGGREAVGDEQLVTATASRSEVSQPWSREGAPRAADATERTWTLSWSSITLVTRVHRSLASATRLSWPKAAVLVVTVMALAYVASALLVVFHSPPIGQGTTDWKGDSVKSHYADWRP